MGVEVLTCYTCCFYDHEKDEAASGEYSSNSLQVLALDDLPPRPPCDCSPKYISLLGSLVSYLYISFIDTSQVTESIIQLDDFFALAG